MNTTATINSIMKKQGFMKATTKAAAMGRASNGQRIVISDGYLLSEDQDDFLAIEFTTPEAKTVFYKLQSVFCDQGFTARIKVLSMDRATETFNYYLQIKKAR